MKINQLFSRAVDTDTLAAVLQCFGLSGLEDRHSFNKHDMTAMHTVQRLRDDAIPRLRQCYIPCKARSYLDDMTDKKALTVLKQVMRLHDHALVPHERSVRGRKIVFYHIQSSPPSSPTSKAASFSDSTPAPAPAAPASVRIDFR